MGFYRLIEKRSRGARDYARLDPVKHSLVAALSRAALQLLFFRVPDVA